MRLVISAAVLLAGLGAPALALPGAPYGIWLTAEGDSRIRISPCGKALCATIVWTKQAGTDGQNPNTALRKRPLVGVELSKDMIADGQGGWSGSIYNPENGKTYAGSMKVRGEGKLEVGGCVLGVLCGSETWSRMPDDTASVTPAARRAVPH